MKIKICGLKTIEDSLAACEAGADMVGFNFYKPSPRYIALDSCRAITSEIKKVYPEIICVGIFVNEDPLLVRALMDEAGLDLAQLSGDESLSEVEKLGALAFKSLRPESLQELKMVAKTLPPRQTPPAFLIDKHQKGAYGGTGKTDNRIIAAEIAKEYPVLLDGGLNPENIAAAIQEVKPWGVDVASGVEIERGIKDRTKIKKFVLIAQESSMGLK
jgi:phosphoribosylanthranilate isomerase